MSEISSVSARVCLFCGRGGPWAEEHINPAWLLRHLGLPDDDRLFQGSAVTETGELVASRSFSTFRFVEGRVCAECNNGWMSRLETAAMPILIPLIDHIRAVQTLTTMEAAIVAKWAAKTAYLHTYVGMLRQPVPLPQMRALHGDTGVPVDGVGVFATQGEFDRSSAYLQDGTWLEATTAAVQGIEPPAGSYKVVLQYRHLYLIVAHWPGPSYFIRSRTMQRLLPSMGPDLVWPGGRSPAGMGPIGRLQDVVVGLGVRHETPRAVG